jgi:tRNA modification GTPase
MSATLAACLTPPGRGALATLGLLGPGAWPAARALFRRRSGAELPAEPEAGRFWLGRAGADVGDEVVLAVKRAGPAPWLEVHCHGGREVVAYLLELLRGQGLTVCDWRAFVAATEDDPLRAAAASALAEALTSRTAAILLDQYQGALGRALDDVLAALDRGDAAALALLTELSGRAALGRRLTQPWRVAVAGAPNVGKSSLVNALAGYQRSVVSPTPGTTRDVVTVRTALDGWPVELADTAGLRGGGGDLEAQGMERARQELAEADLCLWVFDASAAPVWPEGERKNLHLVVNKIDLPPAWDLERAAGAARVSALAGTGLGELTVALAGWLVPQPPASGAAVPFTQRLCDGIEAARRSLEEGRTDEARAAVAVLRREKGAESEGVEPSRPYGRAL